MNSLNFKSIEILGKILPKISKNNISLEILGKTSNSLKLNYFNIEVFGKYEPGPIQQSKEVIEIIGNSNEFIKLEGIINKIDILGNTAENIVLQGSLNSIDILGSSTEFNELQNSKNLIDILGNCSVPILQKSINIEIIGKFQNNLDINKTLIEIIGQV